MSLQVFTSEQIRRLPGNAEVVSDKQYTKSAAIRRSKGTLPSACTPGGTFILEQLPKTRLASGRRVTRYLLLTYHKGGAA